MVFRSIKRSVGRKKISLSLKEDKQTELEEFFKDFLIKEYGDVVSAIKYNIYYQSQGNFVELKVDSKALANDLILKINKLTDLLKIKFKITNIVIK